jgi:hypothetical protein
MSPQTEEVKITILTAGLGYLRRLQALRDNRVRNETLSEETMLPHQW